MITPAQKDALAAAFIVLCCGVFIIVAAPLLFSLALS
jgi:hypothetical protein